MNMKTTKNKQKLFFSFLIARVFIFLEKISKNQLFFSSSNYKRRYEIIVRNVSIFQQFFICNLLKSQCKTYYHMWSMRSIFPCLFSFSHFAEIYFQFFNKLVYSDMRYAQSTRYIPNGRYHFL